MLLYIFTLLFMSMLDSLIAYIVVFDPSYVNYSFVPQLAFMALVLIARKSNLKSTLILAIILGLAQDIFANQTFLLYTILNVALIFVVFFWSQSVADSNFENILFMICSVFIREIVLYGIMIVSEITKLDLITWFLKREFFTLTINCLFAIFVLFFIKRLYSYLDDKDLNRRKKENISWINPAISKSDYRK